MSKCCVQASAPYLLITLSCDGHTVFLVFTPATLLKHTESFQYSLALKYASLNSDSRNQARNPLRGG
jgi:hypothetical protein